MIPLENIRPYYYSKTQLCIQAYSNFYTIIYDKS